MSFRFIRPSLEIVTHLVTEIARSHHRVIDSASSLL